MARYYKSPLCKNCGRNKQEVSRSRGSSALDNWSYWLRMRFCSECTERRCKEPMTYIDTSTSPPAIGYNRCDNRAMVEAKGVFPAVYRDYCEDHWPGYAFCHRRSCHKPKEVWATFCPECRAKDQAKLDRKIITRWRAAGMLCLICRQRPKNGMQNHCAECLKRLGYPVFYASPVAPYLKENIDAQLAARKKPKRKKRPGKLRMEQAIKRKVKLGRPKKIWTRREFGHYVSLTEKLPTESDDDKA